MPNLIDQIRKAEDKSLWPPSDEIELQPCRFVDCDTCRALVCFCHLEAE